ncbi:MAG TPA: hypothetical protein VFH00_01480 [Candidatus Nitrosotalea sp.]|nr:hypothetical protein [Candidatus Nitrosotalea sp.]
MFVRHSVHIDRPVAVCTEALLNGPHKWFPRLGKSGVSSVGIHVSGIPVRKRVVVELGEPVKTTTWTVIPMTWQATFLQDLFPVMRGRIEIAPVEKGVTRLTVSGRYVPPLGRLGKRLDQAMMHEVAERTVKELAESIATRLDRAVAAKASKHTP